MESVTLASPTSESNESPQSEEGKSNLETGLKGVNPGIEALLNTGRS